MSPHITKVMLSIPTGDNFMFVGFTSLFPGNDAIISQFTLIVITVHLTEYVTKE